MKRTATKMIVTAAMLGAAALGSASAIADGHAPVIAEAQLNNLDGNQIGLATITQTPHGVLVHVRVSDMPPGAKGIHFHSKADCAPHTSFKSSMGHHGEGEGQHGLLMQFFKSDVFLDKGDLPLLDDDGTAIVIHANEDDQVTQPIGGAGPRLVCGLVAAT